MSQDNANAFPHADDLGGFECVQHPRLTWDLYIRNSSLLHCELKALQASHNKLNCNVHMYERKMLDTRLNVILIQCAFY